MGKEILSIFFKIPCYLVNPCPSFSSQFNCYFLKEVFPDLICYIIQHCPTELSAMIEMFYILLSNMVINSHMQLLRIWNVMTVTEELNFKILFIFQFSCSVVSNSLGPHGLQHARLPCPSPTPGACSNSCPLNR